MSVYVLKADDKTTLENIENCKSKSMISGSKLRNSHRFLGKKIAKHIYSEDTQSIALIVMMRAGLFFAEGIADEYENMGGDVMFLLTCDNKLSEADAKLIKNRPIIIVDAVINTGKSIFGLIDSLDSNISVKIATTVIPNNSLDLFKLYDLYTVRTSDNQYKGAKTKVISNGKGPDTGDRLFNTI